MEIIVTLICWAAVIAAGVLFSVSLCNNRPECFGTEPHEGEQLTLRCRYCDERKECLGDDV